MFCLTTRCRSLIHRRPPSTCRRGNAWAMIPLLAMTALIPATSDAANDPVLSFESAHVPDFIEASAGSLLMLSSDRFIDGRQSLQWSWSGGPATLRIQQPIGYDAQPPRLLGMPAGSTFAPWVYLTEPMEGALRFSFFKDGEEACRFPFHLQFTGWRTAWVLFDRDMTGTPTPGMNELRIDSPPGVESGTLYLDAIVLANNVDHRFQFADEQVPFVAGRNATYPPAWFERTRASLLASWSQGDPPQASPDQLAALTTIRQRAEAAFLTERPTDAHLRQLAETFDDYQIQDAPEGLRGRRIAIHHLHGLILPPPVREARIAEAIALRGYQLHLLQIAQAWRALGPDDPQAPALRAMYLTMIRHLLDQGWARGSAMGSTNLLGYQFREIGPSILLMRDVLEAEGLLETVTEMLLWHLATPRLLERNSAAANMDFFNIQATGQLLSLLIAPSGDLQVAAVERFVRAVSGAMAQHTPGTDNGFKIDGTAFHHYGHYPGYAVPAISSGSQVLAWLAHTPFALSVPARANVRHALMAATIYSHPEWSVAFSGRHPMGGGSLRSLAPVFLRIGLSGDPRTGEPIDREVLATGLRLFPELAQAPELAGLDLQPAPTPQGFWVFNHAAAGVHRHAETMVTFKGYNRNVWSSEIYARDNRYGRYQSHGTIWIQNGRGDAASGLAEAGWDWNRPPGATTVHLPLDILESPRPGTLMERSPETFAGSAHLDQRAGLFATILSDPHLPGSAGLTARQSAFAIEGRIVVLGTGIGQADGQHPVETTLFQNALAKPNTPIRVADIAPQTQLPADWQIRTPDTGTVLSDAVGNGYFVPAGQDLRITRQVQRSRHNKTRQPTEGPFATAWLNHGVGPQAARYQYAILLEADPATMQDFAQRMQGSNPVYRVLRQENAVHAVEDTATGILGLACFEGDVSLALPGDLTLGVDRPCLVLLERLPDGALHLSVTDPDLNLQENQSVPVKITLTLSGRWQLQTGEHGRVRSAGRNTRLEITVEQGLSRAVVLAPRGGA